VDVCEPGAEVPKNAEEEPELAKMLFPARESSILVAAAGSLLFGLNQLESVPETRAQGAVSANDDEPEAKM
jgi:hypothetical protein